MGLSFVSFTSGYLNNFCGAFKYPDSIRAVNKTPSSKIAAKLRLNTFCLYEHCNIHYVARGLTPISTMLEIITVLFKGWSIWKKQECSNSFLMEITYKNIWMKIHFFKYFWSLLINTFKFLTVLTSCCNLQTIKRKQDKVVPSSHGSFNKFVFMYYRMNCIGSFLFLFILVCCKDISYQKRTIGVVCKCTRWWSCRSP